MNTPDEAMTQEHTAIEVEATLTPAAKWECFCCPASYDMWRVRKIGERRYGQGFLVVNKESAEGLRDYLNALSTAPTTEPQPASPSGLVEEALDRIENVVRMGENIANASPFHDDSSRRAVKALADYVRSEAAEIRAALAAPATADDVRPSNGAWLQDLLDLEDLAEHASEPLSHRLLAIIDAARLATPPEQDRSTSKGEGA